LLLDDDLEVHVNDPVALRCLTKLHTLIIRGGGVTGNDDVHDADNRDNFLVQLLTPLGEHLSVLELWLWLPFVPGPFACVGRCCPQLRSLTFWGRICFADDADATANLDERPLFPLLELLALDFMSPGTYENPYS
jgi:hypothetical protein